MNCILPLLVACAVLLPAAGPLPRIQVSENRRFLVTADGRPFFWLGDTCWRMIEKAQREDGDLQPGIDKYFANRAAKRFNIIQTRITGGSNEPNTYGYPPFEAGDFSRPKVTEGPNNDFWDMADYILDAGQSHGLYFALLPVWADSVSNDHQWVSDPASAYRYGRFLGSRYRERTNIIWIMGGDMVGLGRGVEDPKRRKMIQAMAEGVTDGVAGVDNFDGKALWSRTLMSFHPPGSNRSSSQFLHGEPWLDFNMIQTTSRFHFASYENIFRDYVRQPVKPVLESEVAYEESFPLRNEEKQQRPGERISPWDVRRAAYWTVFSGGFGFTYGNRNFIAWMRKGESDEQRGAYRPWYESLDTPGAFQMSHLRALLESRPFLTRIPDDAILIGVAWEAPDRVVAARDRLGAYALVYTPTGRRITVIMSAVAGRGVKAWWFDPRDGTASAIGDFAADGTREFTPPSQGPGNDWVLVLDSIDRNFPPPGQTRSNH